MAVYKRGYRPYVGEQTPSWSRFLILPRYSMENLFDSKFLLGYVILCFVPFLISAAIIYFYNNPLARTLIGMRGDPSEFFFRIDNSFFNNLLKIQGTMAFLLTAWVGPGLVAPDLANNALPLYLSRPISRVEYVMGKVAVLFGLLSIVTWIPDALLYSLQAGLAGSGWFSANLRILWGIFAGSMIWIFILSLLSLALSAWVKWRVAATGLLVGIFFVAAGFGTAVNAVLRTYWGGLLNLSYLISLVWSDLFDIPVVHRTLRGRLEEASTNDVPVGYAWMMLLAICVVCLMLLNKRLRAREVVR